MALTPPSFFEGFSPPPGNVGISWRRTRSLLARGGSSSDRRAVRCMPCLNCYKNADDAGATRAEAFVDEGTFVFRHNGRDFDEGDFASLCRFAWSNKRRLLTIGFRGIGFRSVFALGAVVEVITPTIACRFEERRFTEPIWLPDADGTVDTEIRVRLGTVEADEVIRESIALWSQAPVPLLYFRSLRTLVLDGAELAAREVDSGPIDGRSRSEWPMRCARPTVERGARRTPSKRRQTASAARRSSRRRRPCRRTPIPTPSRVVVRGRT